MAIRTYLSGDLPTSNQYIKMRIEVLLNSQSIESNTSSITVNLYYRRTNTGYTTYGTGTCYMEADGVQYTQAVSPSQKFVYSTGNGICLFTRTITISHDVSGNKWLNVWGKISIPGANLGGEWQSFGVTLPSIPRADD